MEFKGHTVDSPRHCTRTRACGMLAAQREMELKKGVGLSCTWDVRGDIAAVVHIVSSGSDDQLDDPRPTEQAPPISLCVPTSEPDRPCQLHLDVTRLQGYAPSRLELTSTSRTIELYRDEDEYLGTVRGSVAGNCDSYEGCGQRFYCCAHNLTSDNVTTKLTVKLLSLRGRAKVIVNRLQLTVAADPEGSTTQSLRVQSEDPSDVRQLLSSFPGGNMPPFLKTLVSSLSHLTSQARSEGAAPVSDEERPPELSQLMQTLRHLRPHPPPVEVESCRDNGETAGNGDTPRDSASTETPVDDDSAGMEARLKLYIDEKFEQLERRLEKKLEELVLNRLQELTSSKPLLLEEELD